MKYILMITLVASVIGASYLYQRHENQQKAQALAAMNEQNRKAEEAARLAEQEDAAMALAALAAKGEHGANQAAIGSGSMDGLDRVKLEFDSRLANTKKKHKMKHQESEEEFGSYASDEADGFKYSSAQYSHPGAEHAEIKAVPTTISDDLLIVESRLEDRAARARR